MSSTVLYENNIRLFVGQKLVQIFFYTELCIFHIYNVHNTLPFNFPIALSTFVHLPLPISPGTWDLTILV